MGVVVPFPTRGIGRFTPDMRDQLARLAATSAAYRPLLFGLDEHRREYYRFADLLMVGWDAWGRLVLTDIASGYVDHGPFHGLDEVCRLIASLTPWTEPPVAERRRSNGATRHPGRR